MGQVMEGYGGKYREIGNMSGDKEREYTTLVENNTDMLFKLFKNKDILQLGQEVFGTQQEFVKRVCSIHPMISARWIDQPHDKIIEELYKISFGNTA